MPDADIDPRFDVVTRSSPFVVGKQQNNKHRSPVKDHTGTQHSTAGATAGIVSRLRMMDNPIDGRYDTGGGLYFSARSMADFTTVFQAAQWSTVNTAW